MFVERLNKKLREEYGPNCHQTIEEIDQNYYFSKKEQDNIEKVDRVFKKIKTAKN